MKTVFDFFFALFLFSAFLPALVILLIMCSLDTKSSGIFSQERIGRHGKIFRIYKLRTFHKKTHSVSKFGNFLRKYKIDEIPQLLNILKGDMSFVGPRPDIAGYYDTLQGENRVVLRLKPGLTSEASIKYRNEEELLKKQQNPPEYNDKIIFPDKVKMNIDYYYNRSFAKDLKILWKTVFH